MPDEPKFLNRPPPVSPEPARPKPSNAPPPAGRVCPAADTDLLRVQCEAGAAANALFEAGRSHEAEEAFQALIDHALRAGHVDAYVIGKAVLGILCARVHRRDAAGAHAIWIAGDEQPGWQLGVMALEHEWVSAHDTAVYAYVCAVLHALDGDPMRGLAGVNHCMTRLAAYAEVSAPGLLPLLAAAWPKRLETIFEVPFDRIPEHHRGAFQRWRDRFGELGKPGRLAPAPWHVPDQSRPTLVFRPDGQIIREG